MVSDERQWRGGMRTEGSHTFARTEGSHTLARTGGEPAIRSPQELCHLTQPRWQCAQRAVRAKLSAGEAWLVNGTNLPVGHELERGDRLRRSEEERQAHA